MTTPYLLADLKRDEGFRDTAYPDPVSHGAPWTIGYGHTGRDVHPGLTCTEDQAATWLAQDAAAVQRGLDTMLPWWRGPCDARQDVLVNMGFNLGLHGLLDFRHMLMALQRHDYETAADEILDSIAALDERALAGVGELTRYDRLAAQMRTGVRA